MNLKKLQSFASSYEEEVQKAGAGNSRFDFPGAKERRKFYIKEVLNVKGAMTRKIILLDEPITLAVHETVVGAGKSGKGPFALKEYHRCSKSEVDDDFKVETFQDRDCFCCTSRVDSVNRLIRVVIIPILVEPFPVIGDRGPSMYGPMVSHLILPPWGHTKSVFKDIILEKMISYKAQKGLRFQVKRAEEDPRSIGNHWEIDAMDPVWEPKKIAAYMKEHHDPENGVNLNIASIDAAFPMLNPDQWKSILQKHCEVCQAHPGLWKNLTGLEAGASGGTSPKTSGGDKDLDLSSLNLDDDPDFGDDDDDSNLSIEERMIQAVGINKDALTPYDEDEEEEEEETLEEESEQPLVLEFDGYGYLDQDGAAYEEDGTPILNEDGEHLVYEMDEDELERFEEEEPFTLPKE